MSRARDLRRRFIRALERADRVVDPEAPLPVTDDEAAVLRGMYGGPPHVLADRRALLFVEIDEEVVATVERVVARLERIARRTH